MRRIFFIIFSFVIIILALIGILCLISKENNKQNRWKKTFFPSPPIKKKLKPRWCVDYRGNPQDEKKCKPISKKGRGCRTDKDCYATCGLGCLSRLYPWPTGIVDCEAIPEYKCSCINNLCQPNKNFPPPE